MLIPCELAAVYDPHRTWLFFSFTQVYPEKYTPPLLTCPCSREALNADAPRAEINLTLNDFFFFFSRVPVRLPVSYIHMTPI